MLNRVAPLLAAMLLFTQAGVASDWPMWRHDPARSGATAGGLPDELHLQWTLKLPRQVRAWPESQPKLNFDAGYEPVVAGNRLLIGSTVDGSITTFDTGTAAVQWRFFTNGPVRFAPAVSKDRVYAVSDDGFLYCLSLETGRELWKVQGGPSQKQIIGNDRVISTWPARGGVVVEGGVAYFAAGIWPSLGIFIRAVDAESGDVLWTNSTTGSRFVTHPHGADAFGSISPQGYLAVSGDSLIVPGGRTLPGIFDKKTGELRHFEFGGKGEGGFDAFSSGDLVHVRGDVLRTSDGAAAGSIPARLAGQHGVIGESGSSLMITSPSGQMVERISKDRRGKTQKTVTFTADSVRKVSVNGPSRVYLQAGTQVFAAGDGKLVAYSLDSDGDSPLEPVWTDPVQGEVSSMIAADERLFVVTTDGTIRCFGDEPITNDREPGQPVSLTSQRRFTPQENTQSDIATDLLRIAGPVRGYTVSIGSPSLATAELLLTQGDTRLVSVVDSTDQADLKPLRQLSLQVEGRIAIQRGNFASAGLPAYCASLVFGSESRDYSPEEITAAWNILRPYGGTCCLKTTADAHQRIVTFIRTSAFSNAEVTRDGDWTVVRRNGALPDTGGWTHQYGDAANSVVSQDARVKPPFGLLWFGGPANDRVLPRHGHGPSPQVAGGRLFIEGPDMLRCVDVYNGRVWWERELPGLGTYYNNTAHHPGAGEIGSNYVSLEDSVYVVYGKDLLQLDATTGETIRDFELDAAAAQADWGVVLADDRYLIAAASPVAVASGNASAKKSAPVVPGNSRPLIKRGEKWSYLAGSDPVDSWTSPEFPTVGWKVGPAGFGYGDNDDRTVLRDMKNSYQRVYIRREFSVSKLNLNEQLNLVINYDDGFVAYLNGHEVARANVKSGSGAKAKYVSSHEAEGAETVALKDARRHLRVGRNVLAIEGHNRGAASSDFTLDPYLIAVSPDSSTPDSSKASPPANRPEALVDSRYSSASRKLVVFDRLTGEQLWSRDARLNFRHNAICAADGKVFCIDALSPSKLAVLKRRGAVPEGQPRLLALDVATGEELWSTTEDVFGTFLSWSREHNILIQSGSAYRDRAKDEIDTGLVAYHSDTGEVAWKNLKQKYGGPLLLHNDRIITNGAGGFEMNLLTGESTGWKYSRMYGCNTAIGSQHLLTFRSGAAGFCDLTGDSGTGNLGGFRSSCTSNLVVADGVLNAPDYTRTCVCAYQLQTSLALVHAPESEFWTFGHTDFTNRPVQSIGLNLGAPGDRRADSGVLWFDYPTIGGPSPALKVEMMPAAPQTFAQHSSLMANDRLNWVGASGVRGLYRLKLTADIATNGKPVTVRLVFAEPDDLQPEQRVFSVALNGRVKVKDFDIAARQLSPDGTLVQDFHDVDFHGDLTIEFTPKPQSRTPVLCGVAILTADAK